MYHLHISIQHSQKVQVQKNMTFIDNNFFLFTYVIDMNSWDITFKQQYFYQYPPSHADSCLHKQRGIIFKMFNLFTHVYLYTDVYIRLYIHIYIYICMYIYTYTYIYTHICLNIYIHIYTNGYIFIYIISI
jgi:hypothetical protein